MDVMVKLSKNDTPYMAKVARVYKRDGVTYYLTIDSNEFTVAVPSDKITKL